MQLYPGWSARDNYASMTKRRKKRKGHPDGSDMNKGKETFSSNFFDEEKMTKGGREEEALRTSSSRESYAALGLIRALLNNSVFPSS